MARTNHLSALEKQIALQTQRLEQAYQDAEREFNQAHHDMTRKLNAMDRLLSTVQMDEDEELNQLLGEIDALSGKALEEEINRLPKAPSPHVTKTLTQSQPFASVALSPVAKPIMEKPRDSLRSSEPSNGLSRIIRAIKRFVNLLETIGFALYHMFKPNSEQPKTLPTTDVHVECPANTAISLNQARMLRQETQQLHDGLRRFNQTSKQLQTEKRQELHLKRQIAKAKNPEEREKLLHAQQQMKARIAELTERHKQEQRNLDKGSQALQQTATRFSR
ncbi:hypothetical protein [Legionella impletisoli]|uniref:Uncharacterized protein n=1 Tax=Legionella impletisoli TaxID=343510 RepID=A0A917NEP7_9GAMM|nr:hypothetical protein [Legionella impletisoli]GGI93558.1 hypothetical protein GCM10007966_22690 [Legionella impletisoli]